MKKSLVYLSLATILAISIGCGGDSSTPPPDTTPVDTTAPIITNANNTFSIEELKVGTITLTSNEANTTFSENSTDSTINAQTLTFTAPTYIDGGENNYTVSVTATDSSGNASSKDFIFSVTQKVIVSNYDANASYIAIVGNKTFVNDGGNLKGPSGLLWRNTAKEAVTYSDAQAYCSGDWRLPLKTELMNLMDYTKGDASGGSYLLDDDFTVIINEGLSTSWADGGIIVNYKSGVEGGDNTINHSVLCVAGDSADEAHQLSNTNPVKDDTTNLEWQVIDPQFGKTIDDATAQCIAPWSLPTINQLRSVVDYSTNKIPYITTADANYSIWSSTEYLNNNRDSYFKIDLGNGAVVNVDDDNQTHRVTCVKSF